MRGARPPCLGGALAAGLVAAAVLWAGTPAAHAQNPALQELLDKATAQVVEFVDKFSNVVAEEIYVQEMSRPRKKRTLRSDLALVRYPGATQWLLFRDVYEVDGKPVRGEAEQQRIMRLFLEPPKDAVRRASDIARVGAGYNLLDIGTINHPLLAIAMSSPPTAPTSASTWPGWKRTWGLACAPSAFRSSSGPPS